MGTEVELTEEDRRTLQSAEEAKRIDGRTSTHLTTCSMVLQVLKATNRTAEDKVKSAIAMLSWKRAMLIKASSADPDEAKLALAKIASESLDTFADPLAKITSERIRYEKSPDAYQMKALHIPSEPLKSAALPVASLYCRSGNLSLPSARKDAPDRNRCENCGKVHRGECRQPPQHQQQQPVN